MRVQRGLVRLSADQEEELIGATREQRSFSTRRSEMATRFAQVLSLAATGAVLLAACGKTSTASRVAGIYHLAGSADATSLEVRDDGTFALRRESCVSSGVVSCGEWTQAAGGARVVKSETLYWPTPEAFPSAVVRALTLEPRGRDLLVVGESEWAGSFSERWSPGRACPVCREHVSADGSSRVVASSEPCDEPLRVCAQR